jgi:hypothetical protein
MVNIAAVRENSGWPEVRFAINQNPVIKMRDIKPFRIVIMVVLLSLVLTACNTENKLIDQPLKVQQLTAGIWQKVNVTNSSGQSIIEFCEKDNTYEFAEGGTYVLNAGNVFCDINEEQTSSGTWSLSENNEQLTLELNGFSYLYELIDIDDSNLVLEQDVNGKKTRSTFSLI